MWNYISFQVTGWILNFSQLIYLSDCIYVRKITLTLQLMETGEHTVAMAKMNIHEFNLTKSKKPWTFIRIEEKKEGRDSDLVAIKAVLR